MSSEISHANASSTESNVVPPFEGVDRHVGAQQQRVLAQTAAFQAILKLTVAIGLGIWWARRSRPRRPRNNKNDTGSSHSTTTTPTPLLGTAAVQALSRLIYGIFQPSLIFCSVSKTLHHAQQQHDQLLSSTGSASGGADGLPLTTLALMPVLAVLHIGWGYLLAHLVLRLVRLPTAHDTRDIVVGCTFGNAGPLPLVLTGSLFGTASPQLQADVVAAISFYLLAWSPCFYTLCPRLLTTTPPPPRRHPNQNWLLPTASATSLSDAAEEDDDDFRRHSDTTKEPIASPIPPPWSWDFWTPPMVGSALGIVVGSVPILSRAVVASDGVAAPLFSALHTFSMAYLPSVLLVLAGSFVSEQPPPESPPTMIPIPTVGQNPATTSQLDERSVTVTPAVVVTSRAKGPKASLAAPVRAMDIISVPSDSRKSTTLPPPVSGRALLCISLVRFVLLPLLTSVLVRLWFGTNSPAQGADTTTSSRHRRGRAVASFVLGLESGMPTAQNTVVLLQLQGKSNQAARLTRLLTILYVLSLLPMTLLLQSLLTSTEILHFADARAAPTA